MDKFNRWQDLFEAICNEKILGRMLEFYSDEISGYFKNFKENGYGFLTFYEKVKNVIKKDVYIKVGVYNLFNSNGEYDICINSYKEQESELMKNYGEEYPDLWTTWSNLAEAYCYKGEFDKTVEVYEKVATKIESKYGEEYPDLWITWSSLARAYSNKGEIDKAIVLYEKVVAKLEKNYSKGYSGLWRIWKELAIVYKMKKELNNVGVGEKLPIKEDERDNMVVLRDVVGSELKYEYIGTVYMNRKNFIVLIPLEDDEGGETIILEAKIGEDRTEGFLPIIDEDEVNAVFQQFKKQIKDKFQKDDED